MKSDLTFILFSDLRGELFDLTELIDSTAGQDIAQGVVGYISDILQSSDVGL
jgi:hypothetical protein